MHYTTLVILALTASPAIALNNKRQSYVPVPPECGNICAQFGAIDLGDPTSACTESNSSAFQSCVACSVASESYSSSEDPAVRNKIEQFHTLCPDVTPIEFSGSTGGGGGVGGNSGAETTPTTERPSTTDSSNPGAETSPSANGNSGATSLRVPVALGAFAIVCALF